jgi:hypothetical protein
VTISKEQQAAKNASQGSNRLVIVVFKQKIEISISKNQGYL